MHRIFYLLLLSPAGYGLDPIIFGSEDHKNTMDPTMMDEAEYLATEMKPEEICDWLDDDNLQGIRCFRKEDNSIISNAGLFGSGIRLEIQYTPASDFQIYKNCKPYHVPIINAKEPISRVDCKLEDLLDPRENPIVSIFWKRSTAPIGRPGFIKPNLPAINDLEVERYRSSMGGSRHSSIPIYTFMTKHNLFHPLQTGIAQQFSSGLRLADMNANLKQNLRTTSVDQITHNWIALASVRHTLMQLRRYTAFFQRHWLDGVFHCDAHSSNIMITTKKMNAEETIKQFLAGTMIPAFGTLPELGYYITNNKELVENKLFLSFSCDINNWIYVDPAFMLFLEEDHKNVNLPCTSRRSFRDEDISRFFTHYIKRITSVSKNIRALTAGNFSTLYSVATNRNPMPLLGLQLGQSFTYDRYVSQIFAHPAACRCFLARASMGRYAEHMKLLSSDYGEEYSEMVLKSSPRCTVADHLKVIDIHTEYLDALTNEFNSIIPEEFSNLSIANR